MKTPLSLYQTNILEHNYIEDRAQKEAIIALHQLYEGIKEGSVSRKSVPHSPYSLSKWFNSLPRHGRGESSRPEGELQGQGLYLWGPVGRGKTYVMDCFYHSVSDIGGVRWHYYRFMQYVHQQLKVYQGEINPLRYVAAEIAETCSILCLDEFFVSDIADAMILGALLEALFQQGVIIVTTSNVEPRNLYQDGLQRDRFLPAIAMLEKNFSIINMQGEQDHRLAKAKDFRNYYVINQTSKDLLYRRFLADVAGEPLVSNDQLEIEQRMITCEYWTQNKYFFRFEALFLGPRSVNDYIALARRARTIYIDNVPQMGGVLDERKVARGTEDTVNINQRVANRPFIMAKGDNEARRFISFIDEMYDQNKCVVISAAVDLNQLYLGGRVEFEFQRTVSRIIEMQGTDYIYAG